MLLDKGEFFQMFIEEARKIMYLPPTTNAESDINNVALQNVLENFDYL